MNINEVHWNFSDNGTKEPAKSRFWNFYNFWTAWKFLMRFSLLCSGEWALSFYICVFIYIGVSLNHEKMCIKSEVEELYLNLQQMPIVMRPSCWHKNFGPNGLSAPVQELCLNFFSSITADFNISSAVSERYRTNGPLVQSWEHKDRKDVGER